MFRTAELGRKISKEQYEAIAPRLRMELIELQHALRSRSFPVILVFAGVDGAGKNQTVNLINEWLDPRGIVTHAYTEPSDEERERPEFWRYWRDLPAYGTIGLFVRSWYSRPVLDAAYGRISASALESRLDRVVAFETALADDGALILKFWLHLSREAQKKTLKKLEKDTHESWRVTEDDWRHYDMYQDFIAAAERTILRTNTSKAPWSIIEGAHAHYRELTVLTQLRDALLRHLAKQERQQAAGTMPLFDPARPSPGLAAGLAVTDAVDGGALVRPPCSPAPMSLAVDGGVRTVPVATPPQPSVLQGLDMTQSLSKEAYSESMPRARARLNRLFRQAKANGLSSVLVFEGWDAAGKGGAIRRVTRALDARDYQVIPIAAPTDEERAHHYLWRFWRHLGRAGRLTVFDRSWYGRVLVERVESFADEETWRRAYAEINQFETQLIENGIVLVKYWLHITPEVQYARFEQRRAVAYKSWKLTEEDWRNREKWEAYEQAVNDMVGKTSTHMAPWTLVEANSKQHARIKVVETFSTRLEQSLQQLGARSAETDIMVAEKKKDRKYKKDKEQKKRKKEKKIKKSL